jgi:hypothetical protein
VISINNLELLAGRLSRRPRALVLERGQPTRKTYEQCGSRRHVMSRWARLTHWSELEANVSTRPARVRAVSVLGDRRVRLTFTDDVVRETDLAPLLWGGLRRDPRER